MVAPVIMRLPIVPVARAKALAERLLVEATVEKKEVVVAVLPVALTKVKF